MHNSFGFVIVAALCLAAGGCTNPDASRDVLFGAGAGAAMGLFGGPVGVFVGAAAGAAVGGAAGAANEGAAVR